MRAACPKGSQSLNRSEDIPLSALQHWLYCPRQFALIHVERLWAENRFTAEGRVLHDRADSGKAETRPGLRVLRAVEIRSETHGMSGVADVVELRGGAPYPVEYKRGRPKDHRADEVQLCVQAMCLEEMFAVPVSEGALFYGANRRRHAVAFDADLRALTLRVLDEVRTCLEKGNLPSADYQAQRCDACSLIDHCQPRAKGPRTGVDAWIARRIDSDAVPE